MERFRLHFGLLLTISIVSGYDPFEGFLAQGGACFPTVNVPESVCSSSIEEAFTPSLRYYGNKQSATMMYLFTPSSPDVAEPLQTCGGRLPPGTTFNRDVETEIIIHGWLDGMCRTAWMREMKDQFYQRGRYNVILVDWTWGNFDFELARQNCQIVGQQVGFVINNIMEQMRIGPKKFHIIGHSFGAIAGGFAGRQANGLIRRITGLDPGPLRGVPPSGRLTFRDAEVVDVIHTNGADCLLIGLAEKRAIGDADFYPNGGLIQPSCIPYIFISLLKGDILYGLVSIIPQFCSHLQSIQYFKVSINPKGCEFVGLADTSYKMFKRNSLRNRTRTYAVMGMDYVKYRQTHRRLKFYLDTKNFCPYYDDSYLNGRRFPFNTSCPAL